MNDLEWSNLIADLYDAASGDRSFTPIATKIAVAFRSESCNIHVRNGFAGPIEQLTFTPNYTPELLASYDAYYFQHDVWLSRGLRHPPGTILGSDDLISDSEFRETVIYREHTRFAKCFYLMGAVLPIGGPDGAFGAFAIYRPESQAMFSSEDKTRGALLLPHLKRALQLRERLAKIDIQRQAMLKSMEMATLGMMLVAGDGRIMFANQAAEDLLRAGNVLVMSHQRLRATSQPIDTELQFLVQSAAQAAMGECVAAGGFLHLPRQDAKPISLSVYPFMAQFTSNGSRIPSSLIFIGDPDLQRPPRRDVLAQMYGLTKAESKLFEALLAGERLQEYADRSSIGLQTVKTQLSRLFHKTGNTRQSDLMRSVLSNPLLSLSQKLEQKSDPETQIDHHP